MKIQLKRSNVLTGGVAKTPTAEQMEYGELAVNYNETDPVIFIKDSTDAIIRLAGAGASGSFDGDYNNLTNKPTIGDGLLTLNDANGDEIGTFTANQTGPEVITLPAGFSGDYDDLSNLPTIGDGEITIKQGGTEVGKFTVNQVGTTEIDLSGGAIYTAGNGLNLDVSNEFTAVAQAGYGIAVEATGIRIGDDWSNIPTLV